MSTKKRTGEDALFESGLSDEVIFYGMVEALVASEKTEKDIKTILLGEWKMSFSPFYAMFRFSDSLFGSDFWCDRESEYRNDGVEVKVWVGDPPKIIGQLARKLTPAEITRLPFAPTPERSVSDLLNPSFLFQIRFYAQRLCEIDKHTSWDHEISILCLDQTVRLKIEFPGTDPMYDWLIKFKCRPKKQEDRHLLIINGTQILKMKPCADFFTHLILATAIQVIIDRQPFVDEEKLIAKECAKVTRDLRFIAADYAKVSANATFSPSARELSELRSSICFDLTAECRNTQFIYFSTMRPLADGEFENMRSKIAHRLIPRRMARDSNDWDLSPSAAPLPPREKCYIAGAIGSMPEAEYRPLFEAGAAEARALGFEPISPIDLPHNHDRSYGSYMKEDLTELLKCKAIYVLRNWRHSPGAKFEIETAVFCGINVIFQ